MRRTATPLAPAAGVTTPQTSAARSGKVPCSLLALLEMEKHKQEAHNMSEHSEAYLHSASHQSLMTPYEERQVQAMVEELLLNPYKKHCAGRDTLHKTHSPHELLEVQSVPFTI